jgi:hypothetical protein
VSRPRDEYGNPRIGAAKPIPNGTEPGRWGGMCVECGYVGGWVWDHLRQAHPGRLFDITVDPPYWWWIIHGETGQ